MADKHRVSKVSYDEAENDFDGRTIIDRIILSNGSDEDPEVAQYADSSSGNDHGHGCVSKILQQPPAYTIDWVMNDVRNRPLVP